MESKIEITNNSSEIKLEYDEKSPITGNKCVIVEADITTGQEHRMCMESGFITRTDLVLDSEECKTHEQGCTELMKKLKMVDMELNSVWYPTFIQMPGGMLYCDGNGAVPTDYQWYVAKVVPINENDKLKYPIPNKDGKYFTSQLDVKNAIKFNGVEFESALNEFYKIIQEHTNED
jgi:hypothetical protein